MKLLLIGTILLSITMSSVITYADDTVPVFPNNADGEMPLFDIEGMSLNDGQKWAMDDHTRQSFDIMAKSFLSIDIYSLNNDALKAEGITLQNNVDGLIQGCTMEGNAHDQLHTFLMGYMPEVKALIETGSVENAKIIQLYLQNYSKYFK